LSPHLRSFSPTSWVSAWSEMLVTKSRCEVLTEVTVENRVFCVVMLYSLERVWHFGGTYHLTLNTESTCSSKVFRFLQITQHHNQDCALQIIESLVKQQQNIVKHACVCLVPLDVVNVQLPDLCPSRQRHGIYLSWGQPHSTLCYGQQSKVLVELDSYTIYKALYVLINVLKKRTAPSPTLMMKAAGSSKTSVSTHMVP
jgi:hypothetical protein